MTQSQRGRPTPAARLVDVYVRAGVRPGVEALNGVSLDIVSGTLTVVRGGAGSGQRTVLRALAGLVPIHLGLVEVTGLTVAGSPSGLTPDTQRGGMPFCTDPDANPREWRRRLGLVRERPDLVSYLTVAENLALPVTWQKTTAIHEHVERLLDALDLQGLRDQYPDQLADRQRHRVAVAQALAYDPDLLVVEDLERPPTPPGASTRVFGPDADESDPLVHRLVSLVRVDGRTIVTALPDAALVAAADQVCTLAAGRVTDRMSR